jgi:hypothetical protein
MKKMLLIALLAIIFATPNATANATFFIGTTEISIQTSEHKKAFTLQMENIGAQIASVDILNAQHQLLKSIDVKKMSNFSSNFVLNDLESGEYSLIFHSPTQKTVLPFSICSSEITMRENKIFTHYAPNFYFKNDILGLNALNNAPTALLFHLYDENDNLLISESLDKVSINRTYNLGRLPNGTYRAVTKIGDQAYTNFFERK